MTDHHIGRSFEGHTMEDACPCPQAACGLVTMKTALPDCPQHAFGAAKTMRQGHPDRDCPALSPREWAEAQLVNLDTVIAYMEATEEDAWNLDTVRSKDGAKNCFFGHLFNMSPDEDRANALWGLFEDLYATTFMVYGINDAPGARYPQDTPKQRVIAYLRDLASGKEKTSAQVVEDHYVAWTAGK